MIDNGTRSPFLTFPAVRVLMEYKGATLAGVGVAMAPPVRRRRRREFVCGVMAERIGIIRAVVITETATTVGIIAVVASGRCLSRTPLPRAPRGRAERYVVGAVRHVAGS
jgi:hypothetical protein